MGRRLWSILHIIVPQPFASVYGVYSKNEENIISISNKLDFTLKWKLTRENIWLSCWRNSKLPNKYQHNTVLLLGCHSDFSLMVCFRDDNCHSPALTRSRMAGGDILQGQKWFSDFATKHLTIQIFQKPTSVEEVDTGDHMQGIYIYPDWSSCVEGVWERHTLIQGQDCQIHARFNVLFSRVLLQNRGNRLCGRGD